MKRCCRGILVPVYSALLVALPASAHEIYSKFGFSGIGIGYSYGFNQYLNARTDYSTIGTYQYTARVNRLKLKTKFKANQLGLYGDWFPVGRGFRITAGVHQRKFNAHSQIVDGQYTIKINSIKKTLKINARGRASGKVEFSSLAPYLGIGWGHQSNEPGFAFIADLGVSFGKAKTRFKMSESTRNALDFIGFLTKNPDLANEEIAKQSKAFDNLAGGIKIWPQVYIGISYNF